MKKGLPRSGCSIRRRPDDAQLMTNVPDSAAEQPIFTYYAYSSGAVSEAPLATPLSHPRR